MKSQAKFENLKLPTGTSTSKKSQETKGDIDKDKWGNTALHRFISQESWSFSDEQNARGIQSYIDEGFDINEANSFGTTPLLMGIWTINPFLVEQLIQRGAHANFSLSGAYDRWFYRDGSSVYKTMESHLKLACLGGAVSLRNGHVSFDPDIINIHTLHNTKTSSIFDVYRQLRTLGDARVVSILETLWRENFDFTQQDQNGEYLMDYALSQHRVPVLKWLLKNDFKLSKQSISHVVDRRISELQSRGFGEDSFKLGSVYSLDCDNPPIPNDKGVIIKNRDIFSEGFRSGSAYVNVLDLIRVIGLKAELMDLIEIRNCLKDSGVSQ